MWNKVRGGNTKRPKTVNSSVDGMAKAASAFGPSSRAAAGAAFSKARKISSTPIWNEQPEPAQPDITAIYGGSYRLDSGYSYIPVTQAYTGIITGYSYSKRKK